MADYATPSIRTVALVGHGGAGKTSLAEALLARAGARHVIAETGRDWVLPLARSLGRPVRRRRAAA
ncbi:MAG TPA: hypothetical protein VK951_01215 [Miltoncostaeaceae bacterium]|nr:hypothetical protein [Miltoncostaeaceae bacterium]